MEQGDSWFHLIKQVWLTMCAPVGVETAEDHIRIELVQVRRGEAEPG